VRVIINADDFGLNSPVNVRTNELIKQGKITSATILANAPCADEAIEIALSSSLASFGVHLNCTEGVPLCREAVAEPFLDDSGKIMREKLGLFSDIDNSAKFVYREWTMQLERVISSGVNVSHIDSHHHMHTRPWLLPILIKIQKEFGIRRVRNTMNIYPQDLTISGGLRLKKKIWSSALRCSGARMTSFFTSYKYHEAISWKRALDTVELMVHPGHPSFAEETNMLEDNDLQSRGFELITYHDL
jgi:predicted glycoside hydrolase/deacetylase ChbG (UPF0249 family)